MNDIPSLLAIIPARAGSKGLAHKNTVLLGKKALVEWTIEAALQSRFVTHTLLTTDDRVVLDLATQYSLEVIHRPDSLAQDATRSEPVMLHSLENMAADNTAYDYVVLLQPTSPLRTSEHIDQAFEQLLNSNADSLISVCAVSQHPYKMFIQRGDYLHGAFDNEAPFKPRQTLPPAFSANGAIYIIDTKCFLKSKSLLTAHTVPFVMDEMSSIDIDTRADLESAQKMVKFFDI